MKVAVLEAPSHHFLVRYMYIRYHEVSGEYTIHHFPQEVQNHSGKKLSEETLYMRENKCLSIERKIFLNIVHERIFSEHCTWEKTLFEHCTWEKKVSKHCIWEKKLSEYCVWEKKLSNHRTWEKKLFELCIWEQGNVVQGQPVNPNMPVQPMKLEIFRFSHFSPRAKIHVQFRLGHNRIT